MEEDRIKKAFETIGHSVAEGGTDFLVVVYRLLNDIEKPRIFEKRAIEFFNKYAMEKGRKE